MPSGVIATWCQPISFCPSGIDPAPEHMGDHLRAEADAEDVLVRTDRTCSISLRLVLQEGMHVHLVDRHGAAHDDQMAELPGGRGRVHPACSLDDGEWSMPRTGGTPRSCPALRLAMFLTIRTFIIFKTPDVRQQEDRLEAHAKAFSCLPFGLDSYIRKSVNYPSSFSGRTGTPSSAGGTHRT